MACVMVPATGFGVPEASCFSYLKKDPRSRVAANPMPSTSGSFTVYSSVYRRAGSNPFFTQIRVGSGVPGNGVDEQSANAHAVLGIVTAPFFTPVAISPVADVRVALEVSSEAGGYGEGWPRGITSGVVYPVRFMNRSTSGPVI